MLEALQRRLLDILASIYIYNEHRGYRSIDRVIEAVEMRHPEEKQFLADIAKHRRDERKHYLMFRRYFESRGYFPYLVDKTCGHIDKLIRLTFGCGIDQLDTNAVAADERQFEKLCRIIMITEIRGMNQLDVLLENRAVRSDLNLVRIFEVIRRDEPSHWRPYKNWLEEHGDSKPRLSERAADAFVHASLVLAKVPALFFSPTLKRRTEWLDHDEQRQTATRSSVHAQMMG